MHLGFGVGDRSYKKNIIYITYIYIFFVFVGISFASPANIGVASGIARTLNLVKFLLNFTNFNKCFIKFSKFYKNLLILALRAPEAQHN